MKALPMKLIAALDMDKLSPMMLQYVEQKKSHPDCLLFFRLGDFYEMFFDDALLASRELEITLTSRDCGQDERAPMCGVPYHAAENYINRLIQKNYKVAISEQLEDPAATKGLVARGIVRIVTPGTLTNTDILDEGRHNYVASVFQLAHYYGLAYCDITTGDFFTTCIASGAAGDKLLDELSRIAASEIVCNETFATGTWGKRLLSSNKMAFTVLEDDAFSLQKHKEVLRDALDKNPDHALWPEAAGALLNYILETQMQIPSHLKSPEVYQVESFLEMDASSRRNLELCENLVDQKKQGSLFWVLDKSKCSMGQRCLRKWIEQPLLNLADIKLRQDAVALLKEHFIWRQELREALSGMHDVARLAGKVSRAQITARDLLALSASLAKIPMIRERLRAVPDLVLPKGSLLQSIYEQLDPLTDSVCLIDAAIASDAPLSLKEGKLIHIGYSAELDEVRRKANGGRQWILDLETRERNESGIKNLKLSYNKVFGYYFEVTKSYLHLVPERYIRKQTLVNAERYVTDELKSMEGEILSAGQRQIALEYEIFCEIRAQVQLQEAVLLRNAEQLAALDALQSLAEVADRENYNRPNLHYGRTLKIEGGRHPVVEKILGPGNFYPNDTDLDGAERRLVVITGPNMGGKSTYMRQNALIVLMAQMGSFIPAEAAEIGLVDKIFTRIGASDNLSGGESTFMVEMKELAHILEHATQDSLLILDEIGRGTSTFDGLSIAWAVIEKIADTKALGARTLFATHFHELTDLAQHMPAVCNYHVGAEEREGAIYFLHRLEEGGADESYGIDVARLAGVAEDVVARAREIMKILEEANDKNKKLKVKKIQHSMPGEQNLFTAQLQYGRYAGIIDRLQHLDIKNMSMMDAMSVLYDLNTEANKLK